MPRGKRTRNIRELREAHDAAEARRRDDEGIDEDDDEDLDDDVDDDDVDDIEDDLDDEEEEAPKKKPKKAKVVKPRAKRTRTVKVQRMKVVWGVFDNSHKCVATYEYKQKQEAEDHAAKLTASKSNNTHFIQPVKEKLEEKE